MVFPLSTQLVSALLSNESNYIDLCTDTIHTIAVVQCAYSKKTFGTLCRRATETDNGAPLLLT